MLIFGRHPVLEALLTGRAIDKVFLQKGLPGDFKRHLFDAAKEQKVPVQLVPREKLGRMTGGNHQGVIALLSAIQYQQLDQLLPLIYERSETPLVVLLDGITDVRNFGAIARTAECLGVHCLVVPMKGAAQINADAVKSSAGALLQISVCRERNLAKAIELLKISGVQVFASDLRARNELQAMDFSGPTAIILGSEGKGIQPRHRNLSDETFIIPQQGNTDSLNVSVAGGIILYEINRQRRAK